MGGVLGSGWVGLWVVFLVQVGWGCRWCSWFRLGGVWVVFWVPGLWSEALLFLMVAAYYQSGDQLLQKLGSHLTGQQNVLVVHHFLPAVVQRHLQ